MPRLARTKHNSAIYHIMVRSISEIDLFKEYNDKLKYFSLIKRYQDKYQFKIYAYCLMSNHGHLLLDCNGADISRIMHSINFCYAQYYNRKYHRHGHVFQDRFKSKIIDSDEYLIMVSAYIHNNPKDIVSSKDAIINYAFSSLSDYIYNTNTYNILSKELLRSVAGLYNKHNISSYMKLTLKCNSYDEELDTEFLNEGTEYRPLRKILIRNSTPDDITCFIASKLQVHPKSIYVKHNKNFTHFRAISIFLMSCFCNINQKSICEYIGNITQSRVSELSTLGQFLLFNNSNYIDLLDSFLKAS